MRTRRVPRRDTLIRRKYGVLGYCKKANREVLNTFDNIIRCYGCEYFVAEVKNNG